MIVTLLGGTSRLYTRTSRGTQVNRCSKYPPDIPKNLKRLLNSYYSFFSITSAPHPAPIAPTIITPVSHELLQYFLLGLIIRSCRILRLLLRLSTRSHHRSFVVTALSLRRNITCTSCSYIYRLGARLLPSRTSCFPSGEATYCVRDTSVR